MEPSLGYSTFKLCNWRGQASKWFRSMQHALTSPAAFQLLADSNLVAGPTCSCLLKLAASQRS